MYRFYFVEISHVALLLVDLGNGSYNLGALVTAGVLTAGLISFRRGNSHLGQQLMRARVVVQGATVALMVGTAYYYGDNPWGSSSTP
ncbi:hypothetical protein TanjilG_31492 [Lupinus angustifolius]|uniref:HIG1 domain-containing protein n=1 Tax=Lupinus angustifolius TaxID=3871 RepID=A0A4P1RTK4_LUPAN|nr:hypothetical protein TanjilG_31492 [Lupinus angustifolius]